MQILPAYFQLKIALRIISFYKIANFLICRMELEIHRTFPGPILDGLKFDPSRNHITFADILYAI